MKEKNYNTEEEVQKTLDSADAIQRVEGNPFLYTRLQERMNSNREHRVKSSGVFSPVWQFALVAFLLLANGLVLLQSDYFNAPTETTIDELAVEYELVPSENDDELAFSNFND